MKLGKIPNSKEIKQSKVHNAKKINQLDHSRVCCLQNFVKIEPRHFEKFDLSLHQKRMFINVPNDRLSKAVKSIKADAVVTRNNRGDYESQRAQS